MILEKGANVRLIKKKDRGNTCCLFTPNLLLPNTRILENHNSSNSMSTAQKPSRKTEIHPKAMLRAGLHCDIGSVPIIFRILNPNACMALAVPGRGYVPHETGFGTQVWCRAFQPGRAKKDVQRGNTGRCQTDARDAEQLSKNKVTHILSVHDSARPLLEGVKYLCIPAADSPSQNLTRHFKESIKFIHECRLRGEGCLVHCLAGVSRSVTLVIAYIMTITDFGWEDALHTVRAGRSCANPNLGFQRQLQEFEKHEVHQYRQWLKEEYGESPLRDVEEAKNILATAGILKHWAFLRRL
ncbi:dual specificity protein phosphatase 22 [Neomonachus schauinslandi]|uniref:JNK pathway associated phosphatase n=1 Tax=Neomonachus schauinslandi TaxID=29088 RepID=A0A8M1MKJ2_NEOSC|nr:dual specificity protein phosphatase 22 [Neomonachus schauinslandi]